jgi:hypothetical protein
VPPARRPAVDVTVVVAALRDSSDVTRSLASLENQTIGVDAFEVVLVRYGPAGDASAAAALPRLEHPTLSLRCVDVTEGGAARARNLGVAMARGRYVTFLDAGDWTGPAFLEGLLSVADPGVVPTAMVADVYEDVAGSSRADRLTEVNGALLPHEGATVPPSDVPGALTLAGAKLVATSLARRVVFPTDLASGDTVVYWARIFAISQASVRVTPMADDVVYFRSSTGATARRLPDYDLDVTQRLDCLLALGELDHESSSTARLLTALAAQQSRPINDWLRACPSDHERVRTDVQRRNVRNIDWSRANRGLAADLAVVYCFPPYVDTSAVVSARRIREQGVVTDLITQELDDRLQRDDGSSRVAAEFIGTRCSISGPSSFSSWGPIETFGIHALESFRALEDRFGPYRRLYSRSQWAASTIAASQIKLERPDLHWRAELSDPLLYDIQARVRGREMEEGDTVLRLREGMVSAGFTPPTGLLLFEWCERLVYALADEIVFTNENQREYMLGYCADPVVAQRAWDVSSASHHPTLPADFYRMADADLELEPGVAHLAYFGVFYPTRGLTEVTDALAMLTPDERARIRLSVFTSAPADVAAQVAEAGLDDVIRVSGYRPFLSFLKLTTLFDVLLVNDAATSGLHRINPYLPSKLSDYLGSGTPIWAITEAGSVLSSIETAHRSSIGDPAGAAAVLRAIGAAAALSGKAARQGR